MSDMQRILRRIRKNSAEELLIGIEGLREVAESSLEFPLESHSLSGKGSGEDEGDRRSQALSGDLR